MAERGGVAGGREPYLAVRFEQLLFPELSWWKDVPEVKPLFDRIVPDDDGRIWLLQNSGTIQGYEMQPPYETIPPQEYLIFDEDGRWLGELPMPDDFDLQAVNRNRLIGVHTDSLDIPTIVAYRLLVD